MTIAASLLRQAIRSGPPTGGRTDDGYTRAALLGEYIPGLVGAAGVDPSPTISFDLRGMYRSVASIGGVRTLLGYAAGEQASWPDLIGGADMTALNDSNFNGRYVSFDGVNDYWTTSGVPAWMSSPSSFAGPTDGTTPNTWNGSGITVTCMMRVQPGNLGGRTLCHWFNGGASGTDYCRWMMRFIVASGGEEFVTGEIAVAGGVYLQYWNAYGNDSAPIYVNPVGTGTQFKPQAFDRLNCVPVDLRPVLADGRWHLFQFARGTVGTYAEKKLMFVDGAKVYDGGTGNGVNGFTDFTGAITVGKTETTTLGSEPTISNFKGDMAMFAVRNRYTVESEMRRVFAGALGQVALVRRRRARARMR